MSDEAFPIGDRALYARLGALNQGRPGSDAPQATDEDLMNLAAWMDRRADGIGHDAEDALTLSVEAMFAADPTLLDDVLDLTPPLPSDLPAPDFLARAQALVPSAASSHRLTRESVVVPFRLSRNRPAVADGRKPQNAWLAWSALAACLAFISVVGFDMGMVAEHNFYPVTEHEVSIDILDAPNAALDGTS